MQASSEYPLDCVFAHDGWEVRYSTLPAQKQPSSHESAPDNWMVFVHGTPWTSDVFRPLSKALHATGQYNIVLYDLPGYGQSQEWHAQKDSNDNGNSEPDTSVKAQGLTLAALLQHLGLDGSDSHGGIARPRPHVVAHDIAGVVSLRAHLLHGCEFRSLCLLDTNCVLPWGDKLYNLVRSSPGVFEDMPAAVFEGALRAIIRTARARPGQGLGDEWEDILAKPWLNNGRSLPQVNFVRQIKQADDAHTAELLDQELYSMLRCDVKILWGEEDQWIPRGKMDKLADMLGKRLKGFVKVPGAGHLVMLDQPERVAIEVSRWLELGC